MATLGAVNATRFAVPDRECDLILKGGAMSGLIQPLAVFELSKAYQLRSIGGTSSGGTIASFAAAAEFARTWGHADESIPAGRSVAPGFSGLEQFARNLEKEPERLVNAFRPDPAMRALYDVLFGGQLDRTRGGPTPTPTARLFTLWSNVPRALTWGAGTLAAGIMAALVWPQLDHVAQLVHSPGLWPRVAGDVIALGAIVAVLLSFALGSIVSGAVFLRSLIVERWLPAFVRNGFGLAHGLGSKEDGTADDEGYLTAWAHKTINELAGGDSKSAPLTFGQLWGPEFEQTGRKQIQLEFMTTNLTVGRPFHLPDDLYAHPPFYFDPTEWRRYFPESVVKHLEDHPPKKTSSRLTPDASAHLVPLPDVEHLPVIVAWRMSAALPFVLSAVPLWSVDTNAPGEPATLPFERCWFSDGGIASDFPIHFFDSLVPSRPTFAIDFRDETEAYPLDPCNQDANVWMAQTNDTDRTEWWARVDANPKDGSAAIGSIGKLATMILDTALNWRDNALAHAPGSRDRIAHVKLDPRREGGLNFGMPPAAIHKLNERGAAAGRLLRHRYTMSEEKLDAENEKTFASLPPERRAVWKRTTTSWENHRWVRYRIAMATLEPALDQFDAVWTSEDYARLVDRPFEQSPRDYHWSPEQRAGDPVALTRALLGALRKEPNARAPTDFTKFGPPKPDPMPVLRVTPKS